MTSDEELMLAFKRGEVAAFEQLVSRHRTPVFNFLLRSTGNRSRAEDLLQETWLKVVRSAGDFEKRASFKTWVYTLARNLCVDESRRQRHRATERLPTPGTFDEGASPVPEPAAHSAAHPDRQAHDGELRLLLEKALQALPAEQREVFVLREYCGVTFKEIASVTQVPENTVKSRMRYALEGLRKHLAELGVDGPWEQAERTVG